MHDPNYHKELGDLRKILNEVKRQMLELQQEFKMMKTEKNQTPTAPTVSTSPPPSSSSSSKPSDNNNEIIDKTTGKRTWNQSNISSPSSSETEKEKPDRLDKISEQLTQLNNNINHVSSRLDHHEGSENIITDEHMEESIGDDLIEY